MRAPPLLRLFPIHLRGGSRTVDWPMEVMEVEGPPMGVPVVDAERCTRCARCIEACPASCLSLDDGDDPGAPVVDAGNCVRCGACVAACGEGAVAMSGPSPACTAITCSGDRV